MVEFCNEMHVSALIYKEKWKNQMYIIDTICVRTRKCSNYRSAVSVHDFKVIN